MTLLPRGGAGAELGRRPGEGRPDTWYEPAVFGSDDAEVWPEVVDEHVLRLPEGELLDVELLEHDLLEALYVFPDPRSIRGLLDDDDFPQGLAGLYGGAVAGCPPETDHAPRRGHPLREVEVDQLFLVLRPVGEVHALRRLAVRHEVLVEGLSDERGKGGRELGDGHQALVEGRVGRLLVQIVLPLPEAPAAAPHVPVGELVHELPDGPPRRRYVVGVEPLCHGPYGELQLAQGPAVHQATVFGLDVVFLRVEAVYAGVGDEERVGVPEGEQVLADGLGDLIH